MIVYNVTIKVQAQVADAWLQWLRLEHIPDVLGTGCFTHARVLQLLEIDDSEGPTYAVQYEAESKADYNRYLEKYASEMRQRGYEKWGDAFIAFRTLMMIVQ